jgi:hypothetical protein
MINDKIDSFRTITPLTDFLSSFWKEGFQIAADSGYGVIFDNEPLTFDQHGRPKGCRCFDFTSTWLVDYGVHLPYSMGSGRNLLRIIKVETRDPETGKWVEGKLKGANGKSRIFSK